MSISAVGASHVMPSTGMEKAEGPGPDRDGDADDASSKSAPVQSTPAPGTGKYVNKTA